MRADQVITEARARIIWGEASSSVREFLVSNGIESTVADTKLEEFNLERSRELRKIGLRNVLIGLLLTSAAGGTLYIAFPLASGIGSSFMRALGIVLLAGLYGLWKLVNGVIYLVRPQSEHKSIPDIGESDILE